MGRGKDTTPKIRNRYTVSDSISREVTTGLARWKIRVIRLLIVFIVIIVAFFFLTSGRVNQRNLIENFIDMGKNFTGRIAQTVERTIEGEGPIILTEDGLYRR